MKSDACVGGAAHYLSVCPCVVAFDLICFDAPALVLTPDGLGLGPWLKICFPLA